MLNAILVEMLIAAHRTRRTGMLVQEGLTFARGVGLVNGELVALELAQAQNRLLADKLLDHHKIGPELHRLVADAQAGDPLEFLRRQQAVSDGEIESVRQALVEDALVQLLSSQGQPEFTDVHPDSLAYDSNAIRLRIDPQLLVRTAGSRSSEDAAVAQEVGGWESVFALTENSSGSGSLNDLERQVLNLVDGRRSVEELAAVMRESSQQVARTLRGLLQKQVVRRLPGQGSRTFRSLPNPIQAAPDLIITTVAPPRRSSPAVLIGLVVLLLVLGAVATLVANYGSRSQALNERIAAAASAIRVRDWNLAAIKLAEAKAQAGGDLSARRRVDTAEQAYAKALSDERMRITDWIAERSFSPAIEAANLLPEDAEKETLQNRLTRAQGDYQRLSDSILAAVNAYLSRDDLAAAILEIDRQPHPERDLAEAALDRRRTVMLESARAANESILRRRLLIKTVLAADPSESQQEAAVQAQRDLDLTITQTTAAIASLEPVVAIGRVVEVRDQITRSGLADRVEGSELEAELKRILALATAIDAELDAAAQLAAAAVTGDPSASASVAAARLRELTARVTDHPKLLAIRADVALAVDLELAAAGVLIADEIPALRIRATAPGAPVAALENRMARLLERERSAQAQLDSALAARRDGDIEECAAQLIELLDSSFAQRTAALTEAAVRLAEVRDAQERRRQLAERLDAAVQAGDVSLASAIARDMGLKNLPVKVESMPIGATVSVAGQVLGQTPLILNLSSLARSEAVFTFTLPDYEPATVNGHDAENGWRIAAILRRSPARVVRLDRPLTAHPAVVGDTLVVASRTGCVFVGATPTSTPLEQGGTLDVAPLLAEPADLGDGTWFIAPDAVAWQVTASGARRVVVPVGSRFALAAGSSELLNGRRWLLIAGNDDRLYGTTLEGRATWTGPAGAPFIAPPVVANGRVGVIRRDGSIQVHAIEDGSRLAQALVPGPVVAAWPAGAGWKGISLGSTWSWDGTVVTVDPSPVEEVITAARDVLVAPGNRAWIKQGGTWRDVGVLPASPTGSPVLWNGNAVVPVGERLVIIGTRGFTHTGKAAMLPPVVVSGRLAAVDVLGTVEFYEP